MNNLEDRLEKTQRINLLMDCYEELLTDKQQLYLNYYYRNDLSFSEIALELNVSRNAVFDNLKKTTNLLEKYESKLHLLEKYLERNIIIGKIESDLENNHENIQKHLEMLKEL